MANTNFLKLQLQGDGRAFYCYIPISFPDLISTINNYYPKENADTLRKFWIDEDTDPIDIVNQESYQIFQIKSKNMKIILAKEQPDLQERANSASNSPEKSSHYGITCDECKEYPIRGFRYKCVQCTNYNICMKCETKMKHNEHIMIRLVQHNDSIFVTRRFGKGINLTQNEKTLPGGHHHGDEAVFNSSYTTMMHDLADASISSQPAASAPPKESNQSKKNEKKEEQNPRLTSPRCTFTGEPGALRLEIPVIDIPAISIDSEYIKAGVQILNNFSQMFAKISGPKANSADASSNKKDEKTVSKDNKTETPVKENFTQMPTDETNNSINGDNTTRGAKAQKGNRRKYSGSSDPQRGTKKSVYSETKEHLKDKKEGTLDEFDWTVINALNNKRRESEQSRASSSSSMGSVRIIEPSSRSDSANLDHERPRPEWFYIDMEPAAAALTDSDAPTSHTDSGAPKSVTDPVAPTSPVETLRYQIVYHKKKHINDAIITMMSMGYSNERQWLTDLLDKVNGNIPKALELIRRAQ